RTHLARSHLLFISFFFTVPAPPGISTLSLHDALPISERHCASWASACRTISSGADAPAVRPIARVPSRKVGLRSARLSIPPSWKDRKSTRLNSSHSQISYAVFCLKKKKKNNKREQDDS